MKFLDITYFDIFPFSISLYFALSNVFFVEEFFRWINSTKFKKFDRGSPSLKCKRF